MVQSSGKNRKSTFSEKKILFLYLWAVKSKRIQISRKKRVLEDKTKEMFGL